MQWLVWEEGNPCPVVHLRGTFVEITHRAERVRAIRDYFLAGR